MKRSPIIAEKEVTEIQQIICYEFRNIANLEEALSHPSLKHVSSYIKNVKDNERLEFLGDAVLNLVITEFLFLNFSHEKEGELARRRSTLVCKENLAEITREIGLAKFLSMTTGEENCGGRLNESNLENLIEALIGAIYVDSGFENAKKFIGRFWFEKALSLTIAPKDSKAALQEWSQKFVKMKPIYEVINSSGPAHLPIFEVEVSLSIKGKIIKCSAEGVSKKIAEKLAATKMLELIKQAGK